MVCNSHKRMQPVIKKIRSALFLNPHPTAKLRVTLSGVDKIYQVVKVLLNPAVIPSNLYRSPLSRCGKLVVQLMSISGMNFQ